MQVIRPQPNRARIALALIGRDILGRYRGSAFGLLWSLLTPLFMLGVYTLVFSSVFQSRWVGPDGANVEGTGAFAVVLFAGLIVFQLFSDIVGRAPWLVLGNVSYVKRIVFPLEVLPVVALGSALFHSAVSFVVLFAFRVAIMGGLPWTVLLLPLVLAPFALLLLGAGWLLAAVGVYFRDIGQFIGPITTAMMFLSPLFFPASSLPDWLESWHLLNPLTVPVEQVRQVVIFGALPDWPVLGLYTLAALAVALLGYGFFQKTRKGFADVI